MPERTDPLPAVPGRAEHGSGALEAGRNFEGEKSGALGAVPREKGVFDQRVLRIGVSLREQFKGTPVVVWHIYKKSEDWSRKNGDGLSA